MRYKLKEGFKGGPTSLPALSEVEQEGATRKAAFCPWGEDITD